MEYLNGKEKKKKRILREKIVLVFAKKFFLEFSFIHCVGYQLPFQHNELFHLPYGSSRDQSGDKPTSQTRRAVPIVEVYHYSITNPTFLLLTVSLVNTLSCKYNYFPHISWFVLLLLLN